MHNFIYAAVMIFNLLLLSTASAVPSGCYDDGVSKVFVWQDGRKVFYDFGPHKTPEVFRFFEIILANPSVPAQTITNVVSDIKTAYADDLKIQHQRVSHIRTLFENGDIKWIAPESFTPPMFTERDDSGLTRLEKNEALKKRLASAGVSAEDVEEMLLLFDNPALYVWHSHSQFQSSVAIEAIEDHDISNEINAKAQLMYAILQGLKKDVSAAKLSQAQYNKIVEAYNHATSSYAVLSDSEIESLTSGIVDLVRRLVAQELFIIVNKFVRLNEPREEAILKNMQNLKGNGLIEFGSLHEKGLKHKFSESCKK